MKKGTISATAKFTVITHWMNLEGPRTKHPTKRTLEPALEQIKGKHVLFKGEMTAGRMGITCIRLCSSVVLQQQPPVAVNRYRYVITDKNEDLTGYDRRIKKKKKKKLCIFVLTEY